MEECLCLVEKLRFPLWRQGQHTQRRVVVLSVNIAASECRGIHFEVKDPRGRDLERQTLCCEERVPVRNNDIERVPFKLALERVVPLHQLVRLLRQVCSSSP